MTSETTSETNEITPQRVKRQQIVKESRRYATIGMGIMCLSTLILHAFLMICTEPSTPQTNSKGLNEYLIIVVKVLALIFLTAFWAFGLIAWIESINNISVLVRKSSLIGGIVAAIIGLASVLSSSAPSSFQTYVAYTLWPAYMGMMIGGMVGVFIYWDRLKHQLIPISIQRESQESEVSPETSNYLRLFRESLRSQNSAPRPVTI